MRAITLRSLMYIPVSSRKIALLKLSTMSMKKEMSTTMLNAISNRGVFRPQRKQTSKGVMRHVNVIVAAITTFQYSMDLWVLRSGPREGEEGGKTVHGRGAVCVGSASDAFRLALRWRALHTLCRGSRTQFLLRILFVGA